MNIAFIGNFSQKKGSWEFSKLVEKLKNQHNWYIFGYIGDTKSFNKIKKYIKYSQSYENGQLPELLKKYKIEIGLILSIWPETYSKTFFEVLKQSIPVIALNQIGFPKHIFPNYPLFTNTNKLDKLIKKLEDKKNRIEILILINDFVKNSSKDFRDKKLNKYKIIDEIIKK